MVINPLIIKRILPWIMLWAIAAAGPCHALEIEIRNDKIKVRANKAPMQSILKKLSADHGITIRIDPSINPSVTVAFDNRDLEDGLKSILKPYNHILLWRPNPDASDNAAEPAYLLDEIHVFRPGEKSQMVEIDVPQKQDPPETLDTSDTSDSSDTDVIIKGNKVFVPVTLGYGGNEFQTTLLFDTGAGSIVLHQNAADQLGIEGGQPSKGQGVGGLPITTRTTRLDYVVVGPHKKENLRADIIEYQGTADADYNGLLGMNFIRGLNFNIDFENQTIQWVP